MENAASHRILFADRLNNGLVLKFEDGRCAFYEAVLLYSMLPLAFELDETELSW